jgi:hypothetical protein
VVHGCSSELAFLLFREIFGGYRELRQWMCRFAQALRQVRWRSVSDVLHHVFNNSFVYGSASAVSKKLHNEFSKSASLRPLRCRIVRLIRRFRRLRLLQEALNEVDTRKFPWVVQSVKAKKGISFQAGDLVECAQHGDVMEAVTVKEVYAGKECFRHVVRLSEKVLR